MNEMTTTHKVNYPVGFLSDQIDRLNEELNQYFRAHGIPKPVYEAVDDMLYLYHLLSFYEKPDEFVGGLELYNHEVSSVVERMTWLTEEIGALARAKISSMTREEWQKALHLYDDIEIEDGLLETTNGKPSNG